MDKLANEFQDKSKVIDKKWFDSLLAYNTFDLDVDLQSLVDNTVNFDKLNSQIN